MSTNDTANKSGAEDPGFPRGRSVPRTADFDIAGDEVPIPKAQSGDFLERIIDWPEVFVLEDLAPGGVVEGRALQLGPELRGPHVPVRERSEAVATVLRSLRDAGEISGWRDEDYVVIGHC